MALPLALVWDLIAVDNASGVFKKVSAAAGATAGSTGAMQKAIEGAGAAIATAVVAGGALSAKMAMDFQSSMLLIQTQAGASKDEVTKMSKALLDLAGPVATGPEALATSLYHVESVGLRSAQALEVVKIAAEGAKIGHADLEQTTNALTASVASGIPGVQNMTQAMGQLNSIVGAGDMRMQDLNEALGSGILVVSKGFGLSLTDVGSALAVFGDNNIRGADAATQLRMAVQALAKPVKGGTKTLESLGIASDQLAKDMQRGGLKLALDDLREHMDKAGIKSDEVGKVVLDAFGKKAGVGIAVLEGQMDRFHTKFTDIKNAGDSFGSDWQAWLGSVQGQWDGLKAKLEAIAIKIGTALLPVVSNLIDKFSKAVDWVEKNKSMLGELAAVIMGAAAAIKIITTVTAIWNAVTSANPLSLVVLAVAALAAALIYAYNHSKAFHDFVVNSWPKIKAAAAAVVDWFEKKAWPVLVKIWDAIRDAAKAFIDWFKSDAIPFLSALWDQIVKDAKAVADWYQTNLAPAFQAAAEFIVEAFQRIAQVATWLWENVIRPTLAVISAAWAGAWHMLAPILEAAWVVIKGVLVGAFDAIKIVIETVLHVITDIFKAGTDILKGHWSDAWREVGKIFSDVWNGLIDQAKNIGSNIVGGLINGIKSAISGVASAVSSVASTVSSTFKSVLGIHSPSTVFAGFGANIGEGLISGLDTVQGRVNGRVSALVRTPGGTVNGRPAAGATNVTNNIYEAVSAEATAKQVVRHLVARGV